MTPSLPLNNSTNAALGNPVLLCKPVHPVLPWNVFRPYFSNCGFVENCSKGVFSSHILAATFFNAVLNVVVKCPKKQVIGIHAGAIVAGVANAHSFIYVFVVKVIGYAMCKVNPLRLHNVAVSSDHLCSMPKPAFSLRLLGMLRIKPFLKGVTNFNVKFYDFIHRDYHITLIDQLQG